MAVRRNLRQSLPRLIVCTMAPAAALVFAASVLAQAPESAQLPTEDELLKRLRANDAQFESIKIRYHISRFNPSARTETLMSKVLAGGDDAPAVSFDVDEDGNSRMLVDGEPVDGRGPTHIETLIVRWPDVAGSREPLPGDVVSIGTPDIHRWATVDGKVRELTGHLYSEETDEREWIADVKTQSKSINPVQVQCMFVQMALGTGYGSKIKNIEDIRQAEEGDSFVIEGLMQLFSSDQSTFTLLLDNDLIVRSAEIHCKTDAILNEYFVTTSGTVDSGDGRFFGAESGEFKRTDPRSGSTIQHFALKSQSIELSPPDTEFAEFARLEHPPGAKRVWEFDHDNPGARFDRSTPEPVGRPRFYLLIVGNLAILLVLAAVAIARKRRTAGNVSPQRDNGDTDAPPKPTERF